MLIPLSLYPNTLPPPTLKGFLIRPRLVSDHDFTPFLEFVCFYFEMVSKLGNKGGQMSNNIEKATIHSPNGLMI